MSRVGGRDARFEPIVLGRGVGARDHGSGDQMVHCVPSLPVVPFHRRRTRSHRDFTSGDRGNEPARGSAGVSGGQRAERRRRRRAQPTRTAVVESGSSAVSRVLSAVCVCRVPSTTCRLPCLVCRQPSIEPREGRKSPLPAGIKSGVVQSRSEQLLPNCYHPFGQTYLVYYLPC